MILVTGATGHIGNVLIRELLAQNKRVRALVLPGEDCQALEGLKVEKIEGDVRSQDCLEKAMKGVDLVFHLAGVISISAGENELVRQVNIEGTRNIIQAARKQAVRRLVYTSSIHAIKRAPYGITIDESLPFVGKEAAGAYDQSKAEASLLVMEAARNDLDAVIVCPTGVIGPYDFRVSEMGALILDSMKNKVQFWINGAYDFVDVRDVARGLNLASEHGRRGESYILSGEQISVKDILGTVQEAMGKQVTDIHIPVAVARFASRFTPYYYRLTRTRPLLTPYSLLTVLGNSAISSAKARRELNFTARSVRASIFDAVHWFLRHSQGNESRVSIV